ncbi:hypothetical protein FISHEDRAFT_52146, partial [Fistulina hepatica ATCC 64428]
RVSSTLDKSVGKKHLIDGDPGTCWTSQQGLPQSVQLTLTRPAIPSTIHLTCQGGFVPTRCTVYVTSSSADTNSDWTVLTRIYPEDVNRRQSFSITSAEEIVAASQGVDKIKLLFEESSDFFGRVTLYDLDIEGNFVDE